MPLVSYLLLSCIRSGAPALGRREREEEDGHARLALHVGLRLRGPLRARHGGGGGGC